VQEVRIALQTVANADSPTVLATRAGTTALYVGEKTGRVRVLDPVSGTLSAAILDISGDLSTGGERGLLGLAFSPDGGRLYVSYTNAGGDSRLDEIAMNGDVPDLATRRTLLGVQQPAPNHNGGNILFGPDGMLWYGLGDGGGGGDPFANAQNVETLLGSMLRIDVNGRGAGEYSIPPDNPFAAGGGRPEIWLFGVRNPWRFSFDRATGDLWIGDVGQNAVEEIDVLRAPERGRGANLQWPLREGFRRYSGDAPPGSVDPIHDYGRRDGSCSVTGGYVYRGQAIPALQGVYVFGDYCEGTVRGLFSTLVGVESRGLGARKGNLASFGEDSAGELYVLSLDGTISRIVPA
jgi:glucose/arabinose dehydrogenase